MPILYWHQNDEDQVVGQPQTTFFAEDQNAEWWVGVQQCAATIALAAALLVGAQTVQAIAVLDQPQDDPSGNLSATVDEYFWQNPTPPVAGSLYQSLPLGDPDEIPAGSLTATVDEYLWFNPTPPVVGSLFVQLPLGDPEEIPAASLTATVDEYFWVNPAVNCYQPNLIPVIWLFEQNETGVVATFQPEEDFWFNPNFKIQAVSFLAFPYLPDPEEIPAGSLTPPVIKQNYINTGVNNFISQEIGGGIEF